MTLKTTCPTQEEASLISFLIRLFAKKMNLIPSIVCFDKTVKVGNDIDLEKNLQNSIFSIKRHFTDNPDGQIVINSKNDCLSPVDIAKEIFSYLKKISNNFLNEEVIVLLR